MQGRPCVSRAGRNPGFTLLELVVVLFLAGILAALVVPSLSGTLESSRLRGGAAEVRATLSLARNLSASAGRVRTVEFDLEKGEFGIGGGQRRSLLPEGVRFQSIRTGNALMEWGRPVGEAGNPKVLFHPDGSAEEAEIVLTSNDGRSLRVAVEPLTGMVEVERGT